MSIFEESVRKFYSAIDEYVDKYISQQINKEEFLSAFKECCEADKDNISHDNLRKILARGWECGHDKKYGYDDYKKLIHVFDEILYIPSHTSQNTNHKSTDYLTKINEMNSEPKYSDSVIFKGYSTCLTKTAEVAAKALYSIADNHHSEKALIDFYNENGREIKESAIEYYGWYEGHFNYEYGFAREGQRLARDIDKDERRRVKEKDKLAKEIIDKIQKLKEKNKTDGLENIPHAEVQILNKQTEDNIDCPVKRNRWLVNAAIEKATENLG